MGVKEKKGIYDGGTHLIPGVEGVGGSITKLYLSYLVASGKSPIFGNLMKENVLQGFEQVIPR